jgi:5-methyltetrahydropteroyltriglutamate--homocysteine methyltransferase
MVAGMRPLPFRCLPTASSGRRITSRAAVTGYDNVMPYAFAGCTSRGAGALPSGMSGPGPAIVHRLPVKERLHLVKNVILDEYKFAASVTDRPVKVTLIGPDRVWHRFEWENSKHVYPDPESFMADVVAIDKRMISELVEAGCRYVQFDEPSYIDHVDPGFLAAMRARGEDSKQTLNRAIEATNSIIDSFPGVTFGVHICRGGGGGRGGRIHREGSYDEIAEQLFSELHFDRYLEYTDSRGLPGLSPRAKS